MFKNRFFQKLLTLAGIRFCLIMSAITHVHSQTHPSAEEPFIAVEQMPEFPGGVSGLNKYLSKHLRPTDCSVQTIMEERIIMEFIISKEGNPIFQACTPVCATTHVRTLIQSMPCWKPGMQNGKPVAVRYSVPMQICGTKE